VCHDRDFFLRPIREPNPGFPRARFDGGLRWGPFHALAIPPGLHQVQVHWFPRELVLEVFDRATRVAGQVAGLLQLGEGDDLQGFIGGEIWAEG